MKNPFTALFRARDKPQDSVSAAPTFYFGTSGAGKPVNATTAIQLSTVYLSGSLTLPEYIYATYNELMKNGWRMKEIDEMDMLGFLRLRAWDATREQEKKKPRQRFIDEVWPGVKPG